MKSIQFKKCLVSISVISILLALNTVNAQSKKKLDKDTEEWRYEIEAVSIGDETNNQVKVWTYVKKPENANEQAKKNAVHAIIFKGYPDKGRIEGRKALSRNPNLEEEHAEFFDEFFASGGKYQKYVSLVSQGQIGPGDRIKINKKLYKIGIVVSVNITDLRKDLENEGILVGLGSGF